MYTVTIDKSISSAHYLRCYEGKCRELHGHNWVFQVSVTATELDKLGMVVEFGEIKKALTELLEPLDHKVINDLPPFDQLNPTAENLCAYVYQQLQKRVSSDRVRVTRVKVWETPTNVAEYSEI